MFKEIARRVETTVELLRGKDRRWDISTKRAEAVAILVREYGYTVSEVAKYLGRDQANVSTMGIGEGVRHNNLYRLEPMRGFC